jgi:hypothetical protein
VNRAAIPPVRHLALLAALVACDGGGLNAPSGEFGAQPVSATPGETPAWARRTLYGHLSPLLALVHVDGGIVDGASLVGKKRLLVFWDHATRVEQGHAANMLQVLQKADEDLRRAGVDVLFAQIRFPSNNGRKAPMNDTDLRNFHATHGIPGGPVVPMYRFPNATEHKRALMRGYEGSTTWYEYLREPPAIVMLGADGEIRWHSEGLIPPPPGDTVFKDKEDQYTLIQAIEFAITTL